MVVRRRRSAKQKTRLLVVVIDLAGGTGTFCRTLANGLKRFWGDEFEVSLLVLRERSLVREDCTLFSQIHVIKAEVHTNWRRWMETPIHAMRVKAAIARIPSDVILTVGTYANLLVPTVAPNRRVILSVHTNTTEQLKSGRFPRVIGQLMRLGYPRRPIVVPAQGVADDLKKSFGVRDVKVIPHGVDIARIQELAEERPEDLPTARPYMVACGRLTAQKDYPTLLKAYAKAKTHGITEDLVIVGDGEDRAELERLVDELGATNAVHFVGHQNNPFGFIKQARFFVLPSIWEGFGLVLLEAMALGLPVISTDCPSGPAEILDGGRFGVLVKVGDHAGLAAAITELSKSASTRESLSQLSRQRAQQLSLEQMAQAYRDLLVS